MKFKLDENLGNKALEVLQIAGLEAKTIPQEELYGIEDKKLIEVCQKEGRCLITLDLEFGNPLIYNPSHYNGIVVLRLPPRPSHHDLLELIKTFTNALGNNDINGKLWIVQRGRIREYQPDPQ